MSKKILEIVTLLDEFFEDDKKVVAWLLAKNPLLGNISPINFMNNTDHGIDKVYGFVKDQSIYWRQYNEMSKVVAVQIAHSDKPEKPIKKYIRIKKED
jgi:hypothetical protein